MTNRGFFGRRSKYGAKRTQIDGHMFDSKAEAKRYQELKLMAAAGAIREIVIHPRFSLSVNNRLVGAYVADFAYYRNHDELVVEDVKGVSTPVFKLKKKLMLACYGIEVQEIKTR